MLEFIFLVFVRFWELEFGKGKMCLMGATFMVPVILGHNHIFTFHYKLLAL
jgi:hypothetical protein